MTIIEWDDVPIARQLTRENVGLLRANEDGWAQALADAALSLTQAERDALLMDAASNRHPAENPAEKHAGQGSVAGRSHALASAQMNVGVLMRLRGERLVQTAQTVREWEIGPERQETETTARERVLSIEEEASSLDHAFEAEEAALVHEWAMDQASELERIAAHQVAARQRMSASEPDHASELARALELEQEIEQEIELKHEPAPEPTPEHERDHDDASDLARAAQLERPPVFLRDSSSAVPKFDEQELRRAPVGEVTQQKAAEWMRTSGAHDRGLAEAQSLRRQADAVLSARLLNGPQLAAREERGEERHEERWPERRNAEPAMSRVAAEPSARRAHVVHGVDTTPRNQAAYAAGTQAHVAPARHRDEHAPHHVRSSHVARVVHAAHVGRPAHLAHSAQSPVVSSPNYSESSARAVGDDDSPSALSVGAHAQTQSAAHARKRGETVHGAILWLDSQQPVRMTRGAAAAGGTARSLLASMRRVSSDDQACPHGLALPRGARAGGPWLRRVTHAYLGRDGVTLYVRDTKMGAHGASALLAALHRWANLAGVKIAAVVCNGKMIYRATTRAEGADLVNDATLAARHEFDVEKTT